MFVVRCAPLRVIARALIGVVLMWVSGVALAAPKLVVSLAPLHSLAVAVTEGVSEPVLLYQQQQSPHGSGLSPDQLRQLTQADVLVWVGPELETGLARLISRLPDTAVDWHWHDYDSGMTHYAPRPALFDTDAAALLHEDHDHGQLDPHFWLDPRNAAVFATKLAQQLAQLDPANADVYRANAEQLNQQLQSLYDSVNAQLAPVRHKPFIVFHDGFQYFERAFDLRALGALVVTPEIPPGPRTVAELAQRANAAGGVCLFYEPQFSQRWLQPLEKAVPQSQLAQIDPLGSAHAPGAQLYADIVSGLADSLTHCLETLP